MSSPVRIIKRIERKSYPRYMRGMQSCRTMRDIAEYCECPEEDLICIIEEDCYFLASGSEVVDLAGKITLSMMRRILEALRRMTEVISVDCREVTRRLLKVWEKKGKIQILEEITWDWGGEEMTHIEFRVK